MDQMQRSNKDNLIPIVKNGTGYDNSNIGDEKIILNTSEIQIEQSLIYFQNVQTRKISFKIFHL